MKVPGAFTGETHFTCNIVSKEFEGKVSRCTARTARIECQADADLLCSETNAAASDDIRGTEGRAGSRLTCASPQDIHSERSGNRRDCRGGVMQYEIFTD